MTTFPHVVSLRRCMGIAGHWRMPMMLSAIVFTFTLFQTGSSLAQAQDCEHEILFLPQVHQFVLPGKGVQSDEYDAAVSQFRIASYIAAHPTLPVFSESSGAQDFDSSKLSGELRRMARYIRSVFPSGLPRRFSQLTRLQRNQLVEHGGAKIAFYLGSIRKLHHVPRASPAYNDLLDRIDEGLKGKDWNDYMPPETLELITTVRDRMALQDINEFLLSNPQTKKIVLIFGAGHDFKLQADLFPPECIKEQRLGPSQR